MLSVLLTASLVLLTLPAPAFAAGEPPELQSAAVIENGAAVELIFNKDMAPLSTTTSAGFAVCRWSDFTDKVVTGAQLDGTNSRKIKLTLETTIKGGEDVYLNYNTSGMVTAADEGVLAGITYYGISNILPCPQLDVTQPQDGTVGSFYTHTFTLDTEGDSPYNFSSEGVLPSGLTLNSSTGVLSGTPTEAGSFNFGITVTDSVAAINSRNFTLIINAAAGGTDTHGCNNSSGYRHRA